MSDPKHEPVAFLSTEDGEFNGNEEPEFAPAFFASERQLEQCIGTYLPTRKSAEGNFQYPLYPASTVEALTAQLDALKEESEAKDDKIDGLEADLTSAINVAFNRGATEFVRLNYPEQFKLLSSAALTQPQLPESGESVEGGEDA